MKNPFQPIYDKAEQFFLNRAGLGKLKVVAFSKGANKVSAQLDYQAETVQAQTLNEWKMAIMSATDPEEPDFQYLEKLIKNLMLDNHLSSIIDSRILFCQRSPFEIVNDSGEENEELTKLFERTWFEEFLKLCLMTRFHGRKLIELFEIDPVTKEISSIDEIPMSFFNPKKGIITKSPGDSNGWSYKEGALANYYIQVGKDKELGMLAEMAPIVLAKKLNLGSLLDYIEKYGVPALFITTDREDDGRLKELFEAASNFKSNGFMVGRGQEKFEVGKAEGGNTDNFIKVAEFVNNEMSKRILGGSGLTDEKSFVGSSEIQFRLAKDRFESDKLLIKNIINQLLFPRLQKISPVYSGLSGHTFRFKDTEIQSSKDVAELVAILAPHYELDTEEVSQKIGIKILGAKTYNSGPINSTPEESPEDKKKSLANK